MKRMVKVLATAGLTVGAGLLVVPSASAQTFEGNVMTASFPTSSACYADRDRQNAVNGGGPGTYFYCGGDGQNVEWYHYINVVN